MKAVKEIERKYYKYIYEPWTQPVLTSNGTMGGDSFAVSAIDEHAVNQGYKAYFCFASNANSTEQITWQSDANPSSYTIYNQIPLKITNIEITNRCAYTRAMASGTVYGSNDNFNLVQLTTFTNTNNNASATWNINLSQNETAYKYYKIGDITNIESGLVGIGKITITATAQTAVESTIEDYDFYEDIPIYKVVKENVIYKAPRSREKGQVLHT